jgi:SAM-dependent methyltransferase
LYSPRVNRRHAIGLLRRAYGDAPFGVKLHAVGRFLTCPFLPVVERVPRGARVLDLGAGHGTFSLLAAEQGAGSVVALDPDHGKLLATFRDSRVRFVAGFLDAVRGPFDVVALLDVFYRFPKAEWDPLLAGIAARLAPGGVLLLKDLDPGKRWKQGWNRAQETISDRIGLTYGEAFSYESRDEVTARLRRHGFASVAVTALDRGYPHAHVLYEARWPPAGDAGVEDGELRSSGEERTGTGAELGKG